MLRSVRFCIGVTVCFLLFSSSIASSGGGKLRVVFVTWQPYGYVENGKAVGLELDIFAAVMEKMDMVVEFIERPWKRCLYMVRQGKADALVSMIRTPEREQFLYFPEEHISISETALFTKRDSNIVFDGSLESVRGYTIGVTSGFSYGSAFDAADFLTKDENIQPEAIVRKLLAGRSELGIGNIAVISLIAGKKGALHKIRFLKPLVHSRKLYVGFSKAKGHGKLADSFSKALHDFKKTAEYPVILKKYGVVYSDR